MSFFCSFFFFEIRDFYLYLMDVMLNQEHVHVKVLAVCYSLFIDYYLILIVTVLYRSFLKHLKVSQLNPGRTCNRS